MILTSCHRHPLPHTGERLALCHTYLSILLRLFTAEPCAKHRDAIAADAALQQAIAVVLLEHCLPVVAAAIEEEMAAAGQRIGDTAAAVLTAMPDVLGQPSLEHGMLQSSEALTLGLESAAEIVRAPPVERPNGMDAAIFGTLQAIAVSLVALCYAAALTQPFAPQPSWQGEAAGGSTAAPAAGLCQKEQAVELIVAVLPRLVATVAALQEGLQLAPAALPADVDFLLSNLNDMCTQLSVALKKLMQTGPHLVSQSPRQLSAWFAAAAAGIRLLPRLPLLHAQLRQRNSSFSGAEQLSDAVPEFVLGHATCRQLHPSSCPAVWLIGDAAALDDLQTQAWELHTALCRLAAA